MPMHVMEIIGRYTVPPDIAEPWPADLNDDDHNEDEKKEEEEDDDDDELL